MEPTWLTFISSSLIGRRLLGRGTTNETLKVRIIVIIPLHVADVFSELDKLAEKYKQRGKERHSIPEVAQSDDSWASSSSAGTDSLPSALKRKFRVGEFAASNHAFAQKRFKSVLYSDDSA